MLGNADSILRHLLAGVALILHFNDLKRLSNNQALLETRVKISYYRIKILG